MLAEDGAGPVPDGLDDKVVEVYRCEKEYLLHVSVAP